MTKIERIVVVTRKTALEDLINRMNSKAQASFYLKQNQISFTDYEQADAQYQRAITEIKAALPHNLKQQFIDREFLPTYQFTEHDLVITVGPDGLVINTAKYLSTQPIFAINPDPARIDGILIPFTYNKLMPWLNLALQEKLPITPVSMVKASLNDGQVLYAVNDLFIGARSHASARYQLTLGARSEQQSSSGLIISTGAGCTGWFSSIIQGAYQVTNYFDTSARPVPNPEQQTLGWASKRLWFTVREPFISKTTQASLVFGQINHGEELLITSQMPDNGVIFSDGIESDYLAFNSGSIARIALAERKAHLLKRATN